MATTAKPKNDAYVGLLAISFLALVGASVLMFLDANELGSVPAPFKVDVPGGTIGKAGEGLRRSEGTGAGGAPAPAPAPMPAPIPMPEMKKEEGKEMSQTPPANLPPVVVAPPANRPEIKPIVGDDAPPRAVKPFEVPNE